ncbi:MAG: transglutaminase family protein [Prevotella sp.]|nr:transglutaminase family protein [Prevotella sp.]
MRRIIVLSVCLLAGLVESLAQAPHVVVEKDSEVVECVSQDKAVKHAVLIYRILDEKGKDCANFQQILDGTLSLSGFKAVYKDGAGKELKTVKQGGLKKTEYAPGEVTDNYMMYYEYTPPTYPLTVEYQYDITYSKGIVSFPPFAPQHRLGMAVKHASYRLIVPAGMKVRQAVVNMEVPVRTHVLPKGKTQFDVEVSELPAIFDEPYMPEKSLLFPVAFFAPETFRFYGSSGDMKTIDDFGRWQAGLLAGTDELPESLKVTIHQLTDTCRTKREKVAALLGFLRRTTRYNSVQLGIGGWKPAFASRVCQLGMGDCKGLSNYMRAMLREVSIPSFYTVINTDRKKLQRDFITIGQFNHVVLQVPLPEDTLWLECTNPCYALGYVHAGIAGHDAVVVKDNGGELVTLPEYACGQNVQEIDAAIKLEGDGSADIRFGCHGVNRIYEHMSALSQLSREQLERYFYSVCYLPSATFGSVRFSADSLRQQPDMHLQVTAASATYCRKVGNRLFVRLDPFDETADVPPEMNLRRYDVQLDDGVFRQLHVTFSLPEGYTVESLPKPLNAECEFGTFTGSASVEGDKVVFSYRMLLRNGLFDKALYPRLVAFMKQVKAQCQANMVLVRK